MRVTILSIVIATYKGRAFGNRASDPKADSSCVQNFVAEAASKCQNCKAVKWPKQPPLTQSRSSHAYTNGSHPIDQPRLKRTFEVILFFEVINNLKGVII